MATLVARGTGPEQVFQAVADEVQALLNADASGILRFEADGTVAVMGANGGPYAPGARLELDPDFIVGAVRRTGRAARFDTDDPAGAHMPEVIRAGGMRSAVAHPIVVEGGVWGAIAVGSGEGPMPAVTEARLADFTELVATAVANADAREQVTALAEEQAALRRVATLVAQNVPAGDLFAAVAREVGTLLGSDYAAMARFEDDSVVTVGVWAADGKHPPVPPRWQMQPGDPAATIADTRAPARWEDWSTIPGPIAAFIRELGVRCSAGTPIIVGGRLWGALAVHWRRAPPVPPRTESRMGQFTELVGTAVANAEARAEIERLAEEQAALRRVATLVAEGAQPGAVFEAVVAETQALIGSDGVSLARYEPAEYVVLVAHTGANAARVPPGTRVNHQGNNLTSTVRRTERPARLEQFGELDGAIGELAKDFGVRASVGVPIIVDGRLWGVMVATWVGDASPPPDTEARMSQFAGLLDTAIANADSRDQLTASRARLVTAGDEARRRVVRDLHDGAQQRFVHAIVTLKLAQRAFREGDGKAESLVAEALTHAQEGTAELRELARGILPVVLTHGGLRAGVGALVTRLDLPVHVEVPADRFQAEIEASAYFIVAEALTNVVKHSNAERAEVSASVDDGVLRIDIRDDGSGGADPGGHGLVGMNDRVTALGGRLQIESPKGGGTRVTATLPLSMPPPEPRSGSPTNRA